MDTRPQKFYLKTLPLDGLEQSAIDESIPKIQLPKKFDYLERDLHPLLAYYAHVYLKAHTKTILHSKSEKKEFGEWIHPDMVGCYFPMDEWKPEVFELSSLVGNISIKLFSFELKRELSFSNLRESFFQTVSNSSWANESYLVAARVSDDDEFLGELRRLSTSFGIGVIKLDLQDPDSSEILFSARYKEYLDWDMINKLTTMNSDFKGFLRRIRMDVSNKEVTKERYDKIFSKEQLIQMIKPASPHPSRTSGLNEGEIWVSDDFDEPLKFSADN